jgi:hypothetical protein
MLETFPAAQGEAEVAAFRIHAELAERFGHFGLRGRREGKDRVCRQNDLRAADSEPF